MKVQQLERLAHASQHAERQHIDLENPHGAEIVLVPLNDGALGHRRVFDRHQPVEPVGGDNEAADMLAQMTGKTDQLLA